MASQNPAPSSGQIIVKIKADPRPFMRGVKAVEARVSNIDKPLAIPTAQEIVMRQELGEFDA